MAGCAISYSGPAFSFAGALRKTLVTPAGGGDEYIEYQGLVSISTAKRCLSMPLKPLEEFQLMMMMKIRMSLVLSLLQLKRQLAVRQCSSLLVCLGGLGLNRELVTP